MLALRNGLAPLLFVLAAWPVPAQQQPEQPPAGAPQQQEQPTPGLLPETQPPAENNNPGQTNQTTPPVQQLPQDTVRPNYVFGANDQILIRAPEAEEINQKPFRIDGDGNINLPLVGRIHAAGMTLQELEVDLVRRLREYIRDPHVFVDIVGFRSAPVYFVGLFVRPGIYPLQGNRTLTEMLSSVGGMQPNASRHLTITRHEEYGPIPLPGAIVDPEKKVSTVEISLGSLRQNINPAENILLQPYDVITVGRAELVYVNGEVLRIGGIELGERDSISILQALSQSGGFSLNAKKDKVRILRPIETTNRRTMIEVDAKALFEGKGIDVPLLPGDIVYIPRSYVRQFWQTFSSVALPMLPYIIFLVAQ
jgi:polysaccharide biosynthesis/export protein